MEDRVPNTAHSEQRYQWRKISAKEELTFIKDEMTQVYQKQFRTKVAYYFLNMMAALLIGYIALKIANAFQPISIIITLLLVLVYLGILITGDRIKLYDRILFDLSAEGIEIALGKELSEAEELEHFTEVLAYADRLHCFGNRILLIFSSFTVFVSFLLLKG